MFSSPRISPHDRGSHERGFSLIELLVVIAIIGVLAAGVIIIFDPLLQLQKARDAERKSDLSQIQKALEVYYNDNNTYPPNSDFSPWPATWVVGATTYMAAVPKDPSPGRNYVYSRPTGETQKYRLYASLERGASDPQACTVIPCPNAGALSCGGAGIQCNYGATSTNTKP